MNFQEVYYNNINPDSDLDVLFAGRENCLPGHMYRGARNHYLVHYITAGSGRVVMGREKFFLKKGDAFFIFPDQKSFYQASQEDPWSYKWIGFAGGKAEAILESIHITRGNTIYRNHHNARLEKLFDRVYENLHNRKPGYDLRNKGILYTVLADFIETAADSPVKNISKKIDYVENIITFIKQNYERSISVKQMADYLGINRSYLSSLFKKKTGQSVQEYLIHFRIKKAEELLLTSEYTITEIACFTGYKDYFTFFKAFKKITGLSPGQFKAQNQKINIIYKK